MDSKTQKPSIATQDWASLTCSLIWAYDHEVPEYGYNRMTTTTPESVVWYIRKGEAYVKTDRKQFTIQSGQWFLLPEGDCWQDFSKNTHLISLRFRACWATGIPLFQHGSGRILKGDDYTKLERTALPMVKLFQKMHRQSNVGLRSTTATTQQYFRLHRHLMTWLEQYAEILTTEGITPARLLPMDDRVAAAIHILDAWPLHMPLPEEELARKVNMSSRHLVRLFKNQMEIPPIRYLNQRKLQTAINALKSNQEPIKEIAYSLGFKSLTHFSTWFRQNMQASPREFRKKYL
jgi:AraC-like DNA-binding protein